MQRYEHVSMYMVPNKKGDYYLVKEVDAEIARKDEEIAAQETVYEDMLGIQQASIKELEQRNTDCWKIIEKMEGALEKIAEQDNPNSIHYMTNSDSGSIAKQALKEKGYLPPE